MLELIPDFSRKSAPIVTAGRELAKTLNIEMLEPKPAKELRAGKINDTLVLTYVESEYSSRSA